MKHLLCAVAALPVACLLPNAAQAGDAYETVVAALPAPSKAAAFVVEGRVEVEDVALGTFRIEAAPDGDRWRLRAKRTARFDDAELTRDAECLADRSLGPLEGTLKETDEFGDEVDHRWHRTETGYVVATRSTSRRPMQRQAEREGPSFTTVAALVLLGRLVPAKDAKLETLTFHPEWNYLEAERPFVKTKIRIQAAAPWGDAKALVLTAEHPVERVVVALDVKTRNVLEIQVRGRGPTLVLKPGDAVTADPAADPFVSPSTTPRGCALRVALAFAAIDVELFEAVVDWPTLRANMKDRIRGEVSDATFRASILDQFRRQAEGRKPQPRAEAEAALREQVAALEVEARGETGAVVTLPPTHGRMRITLVRVEGAWFLARLPGT